MKASLVAAAVLAAGAAQASPLCESLDDLPRLRCIEGGVLAEQPSRAVRYGGVLFVISDKKIHPHFDWPGTPATPELSYLYQSFEPRLNAHVVRYVTAINPSGGVEIVHQKTGQRLSSVGEAPNVAPGGEYLVTVTDPSRYRVGEIQLWRVGASGFQPVAKFYPRDWQPSAGPHKWLDDQTLQIARYCNAAPNPASPANPAQPTECAPVTVVRQGTGWHIK